MAKLPAIQFYPGDWKRDAGVQALTYEERGIWFELLLLMFESPERGKLVFRTGVPMPEDAVARALGLDKQKYNQILSKLLSYGVASIEEDTGIVFSRRMVRDAELSKKRAEAGKMGGNPNLLNQNASKTEANLNQNGKQNPTPSSSSSISTSLKEKDGEKEKPPKPKTGLDIFGALPAEFSESEEFCRMWEDWLAYRRERKLPKWTASTLKVRATQFAEWGVEQTIANIRNSIANSWQGIFEKRTDNGTCKRPSKPDRNAGTFNDPSDYDLEF